MLPKAGRTPWTSRSRTDTTFDGATSVRRPCLRSCSPAHKRCTTSLTGTNRLRWDAVKRRCPVARLRAGAEGIRDFRPSAIRIAFVRLRPSGARPVLYVCLLETCNDPWLPPESCTLLHAQRRSLVRPFFCCPPNGRTALLRENRGCQKCV
jgi:hypothetical protein